MLIEDTLQGVFVLTDSTFLPFKRMSMKSPQEALVQAQPVRQMRFWSWLCSFVLQYLFFPSGIIKGVLSSLGIEATVHAETSELPSAQFQIKTMANPPG